MKFLSLNMISWSYLHLFKSCIHLHPSPTNNNIKLIDSNGVVKIYDHPIHVSEVLLEFPKHLVCHSDSFYIGQKIPPLSDNDKLQMGHKYFLLPKHFFQSVLSFVTIASFFSSSSHNSQHKQHPMFLNPSLTNAKNNSFFDIQKTTSGCLRIRVSDEFISRLLERTNNNNNNKKMMMIESESSKICNTPQLLKDYTQLVRRRNWKPKLETIKEKISQRRKLSSFGIRRKNKIMHNNNHNKKKKTNSKPIIIAAGGSSVSKYHRLVLSSFKTNILVKSNRGSH